MIFGRNIQRSVESSLHVSVFCRFAFLSTFRLSNSDTENNAHFDTVSSNFNAVQ